MSYLSALITPMSNLAAFYPINYDGTNGDTASVVTITDESGHGRNLGNTTFIPDLFYEYPSYKGYPAIKFDGGSPMLYSGAFGAKHVFVVAKSDDTTDFDGFRGLLSDANTNHILLGDDATTKFFNLSLSPFRYFKSQTQYTQINQQAPFNDFELIELYSAWSLDGFQVGRDKVDDDRRFKGRVQDIIVFNEEIVDNTLKRVRLYFDLKFGFWKTNGTTLYFPSPAILPEIIWNHFKELPTDWGAVSISHKYEDEGVSTIDTTDTPPKRWEITYTGLSYAQMQIFEAFNNQARRKNSFSFIDKFGETHTGVKIESYESSHEAHKSWINTVNFRLVKNP